MPEHKGNADAGLREYLIAYRGELRTMFVDTMLGDGPESGKYAWTELSKGVDPLLAGEAVLVHRYELPEGHPLAMAGHPSDYLVLGADDVLRPDEDRANRIPTMSPSGDRIGS